MADSRGLKLIGLAFGIVTLAITATTAAVVANVDAKRLEIQSNRVTELGSANADAGSE